MTSTYTQVFGGNTIYPSDVSFLGITLTGDITLQWPIEASTTGLVVARIIEVSPSGAYSITMPPADETALGQTVLFNNLGPSTITVKDNLGGTIVSIPQGQQWQIYLYSNNTAGGLWRTYQMGASTAQAQASALAGYGLIATGATLSTNYPITEFNTSFTLAESAQAGTYVWTGALGTITLPAAAGLPNGWFVNIRNNGTGDLTIDPAGTETINTAANLTLAIDDSCTVVTDGLEWYTVGFGQNATFAFDYTSINLTGETSPYTLSGSELNRIAYKFVGTLTGDMEIVVPNTTQQYWVANNTTGAYTFSVRTTTQVTGVPIVQNARAILYSDGTDVVDASTAGLAVPLSVAQGGTGSTTSGGALINLGGTATGIGLFTAASTSAARSALSAAAAGANSDITSLTGLTTPLSRAQGGTGTGTAPTNGQLLIGNGSGYTLSTLTAGSGITITNASGGITITNAAGSFDPTVNNTFTGRQTFTGSTTALAEVVTNMVEPATIVASPAGGTINYDITTQSVLYYTSSSGANWTINLRGNGSNTLNSLLSTGQAISVAFLSAQGVTGYYNNSVQVDGTTSGVTTRWQGGTAPSTGYSNGIDVYTYTVIKTGSATFTVLASLTRF
jgi:hypothetical protein